jgi:hypothetical protein
MKCNDLEFFPPPIHCGIKFKTKQLALPKKFDLYAYRERGTHCGELTNKTRTKNISSVEKMTEIYLAGKNSDSWNDLKENDEISFQTYRSCLSSASCPAENAGSDWICLRGE